MRLSLVVLLWTSSDAAKIIFNGMHSSDSHIASMLPLATRLAQEHHSIHFLETNTKSSHYRYPNNISFTHIQLKKDPYFLYVVLKVMWTKIYGPIEFPRVWQTGDNAFVETLEEHPQKVNPVIDEPWDLVFADELFAVSSYALAMRAQQRGRPFVTLSTCIPTNLLKYHLSLGTPFAMRPSMYHRNAVPYLIETFANRLHAVIQETWVAIRVQYVTAYNAVQGLNRIGIVDFDFSKLAKLSAYIFLDDVNSLVFPSSVGTEIIEVGFHCPRKEELSQEYLDFVNDPFSRGTILIAFGSNVVWDYASDELMETVVVALNRLSEYRVVFSYNGDRKRVTLLGRHVKITRWAPQKGILSHNKTVAFISHGGLKSLKDTICGGVPVVYIPLFAEQSHNGEVARSAGFAETLSKTRLTSDLIEKTVRRVAECLCICFHVKLTQELKKKENRARSLL
ncbi:hypothetical protein Y032_0741g1979 [Ancylostoma ceylanicum]|uniref:UDP-glucuronosyltransferase n=1 Tax=Ancylostoma ceylanicum TaxID=53326 RepID=A0A016WFS3_9BILA|nr:hypothetical protein Y032_0741g1979 [Ancylostoma ceylanicum]